MPAPRRLSSYPVAGLWALFRKAYDDKKTVHIPMTVKEALSMRQRIYAFRRLVLDNPAEALTHGIDDPHKAYGVTIRATEAGLELIPEADNPMVKMLRQALGEEAPKTLEEEAAASLERLRRMGMGDGDGEG